MKEAIGADLYNHNLTGVVAMSLTGCRADPHKIPCVIEESDELAIQQVAGTLNPGAHPGSYNGQDAYNDMLVVSNESILNAENRSVQGIESGIGVETEGFQGRNRPDYWGG